jgi:hypothetical protein
MNLKFFYTFLLVGVLASCSRQREMCTLKINFDCTSIAYFDTLSHILITDNFSVIDGKDNRPSLEKLLSKPHYTYRKNLVKNVDGFFYFDSIPKQKYLYLYLDCELGGANYYGDQKDVNLSKANDTVEKTICVKAIMTTGRTY